MPEDKRNTTAADLNDRGQVVGTSTTAEGDTHAFVWQDGETIDLDGVAGRQSHATAISARGHVAGFTGKPFEPSTGFLWWCGEMLQLTLSVFAHRVKLPGPGHRPDTGADIRPARRLLDTRPPLIAVVMPSNRVPVARDGRPPTSGREWSCQASRRPC